MKTKPLVAIVGRPNVGKSSLFNRILGRRAAVVSDRDGVTRDRHYQTANYKGHEFTVVDTGGFLPDDSIDVLADSVRTQIFNAVEEADLPLNDYHDDEGSGLTVMRGSNRRQYLLFRHGRYGGEHDHYDKLNLYYSVDQYDVMPDLGTVAYGAPPHYGYFKNTCTHNTVCINGQNQPPCNGHTLRYARTDEETLVECCADWKIENELPDSFVIRQRDEEAYKGVRMERVIVFRDEYFLEAFRVRGAKGRQVDWIIHPKGRCEEAMGEKQPISLSGSSPMEYMKNARGFVSAAPILTAWNSEAGRFSVFSACSVPVRTIYAEGPGNPMKEELTYLIRRAENAPDDLVFANIFSLSRDGGRITDASIETDGGTIRAAFRLKGKTYEHSYTVGETK